MTIRARLRLLGAALTGRTGAPKFRTYGGAAQQRIVGRWFAELADANDELRLSLADLRARSRQLVRDNGEAAGLLLDFEADIVGASGARLQFRARKPRGEPLDTLNDRVEDQWALWSHRDRCTLAGDLSFTALQRFMVRSVIQDGEFLALRIRDPRLPFGYALQPLDPDQLDETAHRDASAIENSVIMGVEVDANGRPVAYHIWDRHPSLAGRRKQRIPAADVLHVFKRTRVGQRRGIPWFAPALVTWKLGDRYTEAELYQSLLAAAQGGFFVNKDGGGFNVPTDEQGDPIPLVMEAEPGSARVLPGGYEFQAWEPKHPTANYAGFMKVVKRGIARAFGRSYASLTGDLSEVNFSSMRTDRVREMAQSRMHQHDLLVEQFCAPVFADWVRMAAIMGVLGSVPYDAPTMTQYATWMCTGWPWIDPVKDATAALMELNMGITSPQRICAEKGRDFYEVINEIADARKYAQAQGVPLEAVPLAITVNTDATPAADSADDTTTTTGRVLPLRKESA
jgi:lambda family phage portal protein